MTIWRQGFFSVDLTFKQSEARGSWMLSYEGEEVKTGTFETKEGTVHVQEKLPNVHRWTAETPHLYDLLVTLGDDTIRVRPGFSPD